MNKNSSEQGRLVWTGCRSAALPEKCNSNDSAQKAKLVLSLDWAKRFHNTIIFGTYHTILAQRIRGIQQNQCLAVFQRRRLCDDVFNTLAEEFGDFGAVFGTALRERNQAIGYKTHGGIYAYRKAFLSFWRWIFKEKTEEIRSWLFFTTWFSWILNFISKFNNAFTRTLAMLAALDSNLIANLVLRKYSPSFICTSAACNSRLSWWAVTTNFIYNTEMWNFWSMRNLASL